MNRRDRWLSASVFAAALAISAQLVVGCGGSSPQPGTDLAASGTNGGSGSSGGKGSSGSLGGSGGGGGGAASGSGATTGSGSGGGSGSTGTSGSGSSGHGPSDAGAGSSGSSDGGPTPHGTSTCLQMGSGDYSKAGPYVVTTKNVDLASTGELPAGDAGPTTFELFFPTNMEANCPHPIISWGNGTTVTGSQTYAFFNNNAASWGMVVAASDNPNSAQGMAAYNKAGIDYLLAQNKDSSSVFYQKLSTRAGTSGHSQGAFAATLASTHPNVEAEVQVEGGGSPKAGIAFLALSGSADTTVGTGPPTMSYGAATGPAMLAVYTGADHTTTPTVGGYIQMNAGTIQFMRFHTAWFRCFLGDDQTACAMFKGGTGCGVCKDPNWTTLNTKNM